MKKEKLKSLDELKSIFSDDDNTSVLARTLLDKATFMDKSLRELEKKVEENGVVTSMCQGAYSIDRTNPSLTTYKDLVKSFTTVIKQINDMIPKEKTVADGENILGFLATGSDDK